MSYMANLNRLVVAVTGNFGIGHEVPVKCIRDNGAEGRAHLVGDILGDFAGKLMNSSEAREVELVDGDLRAGIPGYRVPQRLGVGVGVGCVSHSQNSSNIWIVAQYVINGMDAEGTIRSGDKNRACHA